MTRLNSITIKNFEVIVNKTGNTNQLINIKRSFVSHPVYHDAENIVTGNKTRQG